MSISIAHTEIESDYVAIDLFITATRAETESLADWLISHGWENEASELLETWPPMHRCECGKLIGHD